MIFGLRRYSKIFKIYCKNGVILNIHVFHSHDAAIQNSIGKSFKKQLKNQWKLIEKRVQNQTPCRGSFLEPFWTPFWIDFELIFDPKSFFWRPESSKMASRRPLERSFDFHWFLGFFLGWSGRLGSAILALAGVREPGTIFGHRSKKSCWESSPSHFFDNWPRKPPGSPSIEQYFILL